MREASKRGMEAPSSGLAGQSDWPPAAPDPNEAMWRHPAKRVTSEAYQRGVGSHSTWSGRRRRAKGAKRLVGLGDTLP